MLITCKCVRRWHNGFVVIRARLPYRTATKKYTHLFPFHAKMARVRVSMAVRFSSLFVVRIMRKKLKICAHNLQIMLTVFMISAESFKLIFVLNNYRLYFCSKLVLYNSVDQSQCSASRWPIHSALRNSVSCSPRRQNSPVVNSKHVRCCHMQQSSHFTVSLPHVFEQSAHGKRTFFVWWHNWSHSNLLQHQCRCALMQTAVSLKVPPVVIRLVNDGR